MSHLTVYDKGTTIRFSTTFTVSSTLTDPGAVTLKVKNPAGTTTTYTYAAAQITKDATGTYHMDLAVTTSGVWSYQWVGTSPAAGAKEGQIEVEEGDF